MPEFDFGGPIVWQPDPAAAAATHLGRFMTQLGIESFAGLLERSGREPAWFTEEILRYFDIRFTRPFTQVLDLSRGPAWPNWCVGGSLNIVATCLDRHLDGPAASRPAVIFESENGEVRSLTFAELAGCVNRVANALRSLGLGKGDAVGLLMPMTPEIVMALLAVAKIGGVVLPLFSGFGAGAIADRLADGEARLLFTADGMPRRGGLVPLKPVADEAARRVPSLRHMIVHRHMGNPVSIEPGRDHWWHELIDRQSPEAVTESTAAEDPLMIIYTSGTTGRPKGAVHTHCGFPVKAAQDMAFGTDVRAGDRMFWITDIGWMMGPWLIFGALILGAAMFLYDGAPDFPGPDRVWAMVERHRLTGLGISPTLVRALAAQGEAPVRAHDLSSLRLFGSTGEPWNPEPWRWLFEVPGQSVRPIINYSGGTEVSGGILMGNPILPLKPCAFSAPCPGIAADVFDESGKPVRNQVGELVIKAPWIGMTRGFWKDPARYEATYWARWPGVWVHGDWAAIDGDGMWYILGRSDDTIKVAGKRLGPAEVESILVAHPEVVEAAAIGVPDPVKGNHVVCFCVLRPRTPPSRKLEQDLLERVVGELGKPFAPKSFIFLADLPKTRNAKVMRRMIRAAYLGEDPGDTSSLVNPESLEAIARARGAPPPAGPQASGT
ncbi:MAG TPA: AMP-binding protein [Anaerolineales bacterium]|nr:AMP-binding protein [Anaerolineales bacterium]